MNKIAIARRLKLSLKGSNQHLLAISGDGAEDFSRLAICIDWSGVRQKVFTIASIG